MSNSDKNVLNEENGAKNQFHNQHIDPKKNPQKPKHSPLLNKNRQNFKKAQNKNK